MFLSMSKIIPVFKRWLKHVQEIQFVMGMGFVRKGEQFVFACMDLQDMVVKILQNLWMKK